MQGIEVEYNSRRRLLFLVDATENGFVLASLGFEKWIRVGTKLALDDGIVFLFFGFLHERQVSGWLPGEGKLWLRLCLFVILVVLILLPEAG